MAVCFETSESDSDGVESAAAVSLLDWVKKPKPKPKVKADLFIASVCASLPCTQLLKEVAGAAESTRGFADRVAALSESERAAFSKTKPGQDLVDVALAFEDLRLGLTRMRGVLCRQPYLYVPGSSGAPVAVCLDLRKFETYPYLVLLSATEDGTFTLVAATHEATKDKDAQFLQVNGSVGETSVPRYVEKDKVPRRPKTEQASDLAVNLRRVLVEQLGVLKLCRRRSRA